MENKNVGCELNKEALQRQDWRVRPIYMFLSLIFLISFAITIRRYSEKVENAFSKILIWPFRDTGIDGQQERIRVSNIPGPFENNRKLCYDLFDGGKYYGNKTWFPEKCSMHYYTKEEGHKCFQILAEGKNGPLLVFIGEARMRRLAMELMSIISTRPINTTEESDKVYNITKSAKIDSLWRYEVDDKMISDIEYYSKMGTQNQPKLVVMGAALRSIMKNTDNTKSYKRNLTRLSKKITKSSKPVFLWMWQQRVKNHYLYGDAKLITNGRIHTYNMVASNVFADTNVYTWCSSRILTLMYNDDYIDGIQQSPFAINVDAQMLLNFLCNDVIRPPRTDCCLK